IEGIGDVDLVNYFEVGATYYFNKNMSTYVDYIINQIDSDNKLDAGRSRTGTEQPTVRLQFC
ncbi:porin, partial [Citrobacter portucalensis]|uniref:porin n=1 Tax=Citrobacter portucalensis TaxID=1639133 RepID=UPI00226BB724